LILFADVPSLGHNPTGIVLSVERKKEIYAVCSKYDVIIVEDEPYWYLQFPSAATEEAKSRGQPLPSATTQPRSATTGHAHDVSAAHPVFFGSPAVTCAPDAVHPAFSTSAAKNLRRQQRSKQPTVAPRRASSGYPFLDSLTPSFLALDTDGRVVRLDTFSKTVAPGCRLGWLTAQPALIERFERISEATTQQPSGFVQGLIAELVLGPSTPQNKNTTARSAFARLLSSSSPHNQSTFTGCDTSGWVRWLEGLRGSYEGRMARMCRTLDEGATLLTTTTSSSPNPLSSSSDEWTPELIHKTLLYTFRWPRGGMFIWLRMHLESHPLWLAPSPNPKFPVLDGPLLSAALMVWLTTKPFLVLVTTGSMFSATEAVRREEGWAYYRLCFAAEGEENVDRAAGRFVDGVRAFWEVRDVRVVEKLLGELGMAGGVEGLSVGGDVARLGSFIGF
jgi:DNA-binding transcriptional MocR family regulator